MIPLTPEPMLNPQLTSQLSCPASEMKSLKLNLPSDEVAGSEQESVAAKIMAPSVSAIHVRHAVGSKKPSLSQQELEGCAWLPSFFLRSR